MPSYHFDPKKYESQLIGLIGELSQFTKLSARQLAKIKKQYPKPEGAVFSNNQIIQSYRRFLAENKIKPLSKPILKALRMKPVRTVSGVAPVTVLTKPFPCPGKCIFCPSDIRMPKSYLSNEPGAQRAERNWFDPYLQTYHRLETLYSNGHNIDKVELIILGGTWSFYPESYQIWFIKECFRALNHFKKEDDRPRIFKKYQEFNEKLKKRQLFASSNNPKINKELTKQQSLTGDKLTKSYNQVVSSLYIAPEKKLGLTTWQSASWQELEKQQKVNEQADLRCVGLVVETRPDNISKKEVTKIRRLGCTKVQIGFQSLNDRVLSLNRRGHSVAATQRAVLLLRTAGFKIHAHWMANLYGSSVKLDKKDYQKMFDDPAFRPDELKLYPCSLIQSAELMQHFNQGKWRPYSHDELMEVLTYCFEHTPKYCRLTRVIRDIPSTDIVTGNKTTNFRQLVEQQLARQGKQSRDIRAREIKNLSFDTDKIDYTQVKYQTSVGNELFIQAEVRIEAEKKLLGFLRLSLPKRKNFIKEIDQMAMIREVHVYGRLTPFSKRGKKSVQAAQHLGIGKMLIQLAKEKAKAAGYQQLAVISAIGTREYYRKLGFLDGKLYQFINL